MLETERLILRPWRTEDFLPYARMNADKEVMRYFPAPMDAAKSEASALRISGHIKVHGYGFWAAELKATGNFIGFIGIQHAPATVPCAPATEIGWRLMKQVWGQGLAPEGALAALAFAFGELKVAEVVSFTAAINLPSMRVMEKIGMVRDLDGDFEHPSVPVGHPVRPHVLYRVQQQS